MSGSPCDAYSIAPSCRTRMRCAVSCITSRAASWKRSAPDRQLTAEGVEIADQRTPLASLGCASYQGYLCSKPRSFSEIEMFIQRLHPRWVEHGECRDTYTVDKALGKHDQEQHGKQLQRPCCPGSEAHGTEEAECNNGVYQYYQGTARKAGAEDKKEGVTQRRPVQTATDGPGNGSRQSHGKDPGRRKTGERQVRNDKVGDQNNGSRQ